MSNFKIPRVPLTTQKSIRFPYDIVERVEHVIVGKECTFSAFVVEAVRSALDAVDKEYYTKETKEIYK